MRIVKHDTRERGDTLVEVLVAIAVFGVVIVGAFSLMNKSVAQMYDSMERSEVRLLLNRQIEALTYARDEYFLAADAGFVADSFDTAARDAWSALQTASTYTINTGVPALDSCNVTNPQNTFWLDTSSGVVTLHSGNSGAVVVTAGGFPSPGDGIWIQKIDGTAASAVIPYKDFYIRACWKKTSSSQTQTLSTVVRLYDK